MCRSKRESGGAGGAASQRLQLRPDLEARRQHLGTGRQQRAWAPALGAAWPDPSPWPAPARLPSASGLSFDVFLCKVESDRGHLRPLQSPAGSAGLALPDSPRVSLHGWRYGRRLQVVGGFDFLLTTPFLRSLSHYYSLHVCLSALAVHTPLFLRGAEHGTRPRTCRARALSHHPSLTLLLEGSKTAWKVLLTPTMATLSPGEPRACGQQAGQRTSAQSQGRARGGREVPPRTCCPRLSCSARPLELRTVPSPGPPPLGGSPRPRGRALGHPPPHLGWLPGHLWKARLCRSHRPGQVGQVAPLQPRPRRDLGTLTRGLFLFAGPEGLRGEALPTHARMACQPSPAQLDASLCKSRCPLPLCLTISVILSVTCSETWRLVCHRAGTWQSLTGKWLLCLAHVWPGTSWPGKVAATQGRCCRPRLEGS